MASDDVRLNINVEISGDGGDGDPKYPFKDIKKVTEKDFSNLFPPSNALKDIFSSLKSLAEDDIFDSSKVKQIIQENFADIFAKLPSSEASEFDTSVVGGMVQDFKHLEETIEAFSSSLVGFLPEDFEDKLDAFFDAIQQDTDAFHEWNRQFDELLENQNNALQAMFDGIGDIVKRITDWAGAIGKAITAFGTFIVGTFLYNQALKAVLESLGEFAASFMKQKALVERDLQIQSLRNSQRLDDQLASNEAARGELSQALEQFKVEMFDLLSPFITFITVTLTAIMTVLNLILGAANLIKDIVLSPLTVLENIAGLLNPMSQKAREDLARKDALDRQMPGLGTFFDLMSLDNFDLKPDDLPPGLREDVVEHPFDEIDEMARPFEPGSPWDSGAGPGQM